MMKRLLPLLVLFFLCWHCKYEEIAPLYADFRVATTTFQALMPVQFEDLSEGAASWAWDFGNGQTFNGKTPPEQTYASEGTYTVTLTVTNGKGASDTKTVTLSMGPPPVVVANFTAPTYATVGQNITFTNTSSFAASYAWAFGTEGTSTEPSPTRSFATTGRRDVTLTATNSKGSASLTKPIEICGAPVAAFSTPSNSYESGTVITFTNTSTANSSNQAISYLWNFGDGGTSTETSPARSFTSGGVFTVTLTATNPCGTSTATAVMEIRSSERFKKMIDVDNSSSDFGNWVQQTSDGGYVLVGQMSPANGTGSASDNIALVKTDKYGAAVWKTILGGNAREYGYSVQQTMDGSYIVLGTTESAGSGKPTIYLLKVSSAGVLNWTKYIGLGSSTNDYGYVVQQTSDGGFMLWCLVGTELNLIKCNSGGSVIWQKSVGSTGGVGFISGQITSDGGTISLITRYNGITSDMILIKTDSNGNVTWEKSFDSGTQDLARSVRQTSDGGYILFGTSDYSNGDYYLVKTTPGGNLQWQKIYGVSDQEQGTAVVQTSDGGYVMLGRRTNDVVTNNPDYTSLLKVNSMGNYLWDKTFCETLGGVFPYCLQKTSDGGFVLTGGFWDGTYTGTGFDMLFVKTDANGNVQ